MWVGKIYKDLYALMGGHRSGLVYLQSDWDLLDYITKLPVMPDRCDDAILRDILGWNRFHISSGKWNKDGTLQYIEFTYIGKKVTK